MAVKQEITIATPLGMVGYGFDYAEFEAACMETTPDYIIADSGSTDSGPQKLALGSMTCPEESYVEDLKGILRVAHKTGARVLIGSAGGDGTNAHVDFFIKTIHLICQENGYSFKVRSIYSDIPRTLVLQELAKGHITPCGPVPDLTAEEVRDATTIVAQMGAEPFITALKDGFDIIIGGRSYDPAMYAAASMYHGIDGATAWHMGKINECGAQCGVPKSKSIFAVVRPGSFDVNPVAAGSRCTPLSVASHTLYEKSRPDLLVGPGGILNLQKCVYEALSDREVRVSGATFQTMPYTVKLEGAKALGYRTMVVGGIRDPFMQAKIDLILPAVTERLVAVLAEKWEAKTCKLLFHVYGKDGVMGSLEPDRTTPSKELCIVIEALAPTQKLANRIANLARVYLMHVPYPGQLATAANYACPITPLEVPLGQVCAFNIYHIMPLDDPEALFETRDYHYDFAVAGALNGLQQESRGENASTAKVSKPKATLSQSATPHWDALFADKSTPPTMFELAKAGRTSATLAEIAQIVRTKNAGPFEITLDVMFSDEKVYDWVLSSGVLNIEALAKLYNTPVEKVVTCMFYKPALAFKLTLPRHTSQGSFGETDMHACQQHVPLLRIEVPLPSTT